jgi:NADH dehydrogenase [ubiquinone] 1 alpha subcomplex assembly factor 7
MKPLLDIFEGKKNIRLDAFMNISNAHYYSTRDPFGAQGDFYTSPELCQVFGEVLGLWAYDCWTKIESPPSFHFIELGPGRGTFLLDVWRATQKYWADTDIEFHLLESSPVLQQIQQEKLSKLSKPIHWHKSIDEIPFDRPFILMANEFLDALPVQHFKHENGLKEAWVTYKNNQWVPYFKPSLQDIKLPNATKIYETSPSILNFTNIIYEKLKQQPSVALFIDYGYAENLGGSSLQAIQNHQFVDPFAHPGEADITAHVDFDALKNLAHDRALNTLGPIPQAPFLTSLGFQERVHFLASKLDNPHSFLRASRSLIDPLAMGQLFKAFAITNTDIIISGFSNDKN